MPRLVSMRIERWLRLVEEADKKNYVAVESRYRDGSVKQGDMYTGFWEIRVSYHTGSKTLNRPSLLVASCLNNNTNKLKKIRVRFYSY